MKLPLCLALLFIVAQARCEEASPTVISRVQWSDREAFQLTDGKTEAIVVPSLARVLHFAAVGGPNWLWNAPAGREKLGEWMNYGGEKAWVSPQSQWKLFLGRSFPPDPAWEGGFQAAVRTAPARLHLEGSAGRDGLKISRDFSFAANGEFVTATTLQKTGAAPVMAGNWTITQIAPPTAVFLPANERSPFIGGVYRWPHGESADVTRVTPTLLRVKPTTAGGYKLGTDAPSGAIAAVQGCTAFVQRADPAPGLYPDGPEDAGFSVELYDLGQTDRHYLEMELLAPLATLTEGQSTTFTVRWSLHALTSEDVESPELVKEIGALLSPPERR